MRSESHPRGSPTHPSRPRSGAAPAGSRRRLYAEGRTSRAIASAGACATRDGRVVDLVAIERSDVVLQQQHARHRHARRLARHHHPSQQPNFLPKRYSSHCQGWHPYPWRQSRQHHAHAGSGPGRAVRRLAFGRRPLCSDDPHPHHVAGELAQSPWYGRLRRSSTPPHLSKNDKWPRQRRPIVSVKASTDADRSIAGAQATGAARVGTKTGV